MKKFVFLLAIIVTLSCILPSCSNKDTPICEILTELCSLFPEEAGMALLLSTESHYNFKSASGSDIGRLYTGKFESPSCYDRISEFAIRLPQDDSGFEIHVIKCVNRSDTKEISELVMRRIDSIRSSEILDYAPEDYEKYFRGVEVYVCKSYVFLLATPDNAVVKRKIKTLL